MSYTWDKGTFAEKLAYEYLLNKYSPDDICYAGKEEQLNYRYDFHIISDDIYMEVKNMTASCHYVSVNGYA